MTKVKQKVSGTFRSKEGAQNLFVRYEVYEYDEQTKQSGLQANCVTVIEPERIPWNPQLHKRILYLNLESFLLEMKVVPFYVFE